MNRDLLLAAIATETDNQAAVEPDSDNHHQQQQPSNKREGTGTAAMRW